MKNELGAALLEAIVGLVVLTLSSSAFLAAAAAALRSESAMRERELHMESAHRVLSSMAVLDRRSLDLRLGTRTLGAWVVDVQRPRRALYRIAVADSTGPSIPTLVTVVYRPEGRSR